MVLSKHFLAAILLFFLTSCNSLGKSTQISSSPTPLIGSSTAIRTAEIDQPCFQLADPSEGKLYHGIYPGGVSGEESDLTLQDLTSYEQAIGKEAAWVYFSDNWYEDRTFPSQTIDWIDQAGSTAYVRLMLRDSPELSQPNQIFTIENILNGEFDVDLLQWFEAARAFGKPMLVEYGVEMNGEWFPWNATWNGASDRSDFGDHDYPDGAERFRAAYQHIIELSREAGATNINWVFHINHADWADEDWNRFELYFPGDEFIDLVAVSIYGAQTPKEEAVKAFRSSMDQVYPRLQALAPELPILLSEFGSTFPHPSIDQANWASEALSDMLAGRWPKLIGFSWWNETWQNDEIPANDTNMRVQDNPELRELFQELVGTNDKVLDELDWQNCP